ncbi:hypothetical protein Tco_0983354 [Tanacetum coccineum]
MDDEHLNTILEIESDEENESRVKDLNLTPSESKDKSEDLSDYESECNMPICNDSSSKNEGLDDIVSIPLGKAIDLLDAIPDSVQSLLNHANSIIFIIEEFVSELAPIDPIPPGIVEADFDPKEDIRLIEKLLNDNSSPHTPEELNFEIPDATIEFFSPSPILVEDRNGESFHVDFYNVPSSPRPPKKPLDDDVYFEIEPDMGVLTTKVVDNISDNSTIELYVQMPNVLPTLPTLSQVIDTLHPFSSENKDKVFNPSILASNEEKSPHLPSHRSFKEF